MCKAFVLHSPAPGSGGWGNGYVAIPKNHKLYGVQYDDIDVDVHGGLTFSDHGITGQPDDTKGMWIIGFDTLHYGDDMVTFPDANSVLAEANRLLRQVEGKEEVVKRILDQHEM